MHHPRIALLDRYDHSTSSSTVSFAGDSSATRTVARLSSSKSPRRSSPTLHREAAASPENQTAPWQVRRCAAGLHALTRGAAWLRKVPQPRHWPGHVPRGP
jgi:hypothetical protein